jgi:fluoroacetyl-CoA thioesterase
MKDSLNIGMKASLDFIVTDQKIVSALYPESEFFREMPPVFATGYMVGFMEWACMKALAPYLDEGEGSVGIHINVSHCAATPVSMKVRAYAECTDVDGKKTFWKVSAYNLLPNGQTELIGEGTHERFIINYDKFSSKVSTKVGVKNRNQTESKKESYFVINPIFK